MDINNDLVTMSNQAQEAADSVKMIGDQAKDTQADLENLGQSASGAFSLIFQVVKDSIEAIGTYNQSMSGLRTTAEELGVDFELVKEKAYELTADGLLPVADAADAMRNLLQSGFSLDETVAIMDRLKDAAAYGRDESLTFVEAVKLATEGIQSGNSILVENAGVTQNLSDMLQAAGFSATELAVASEDAGARIAIFNGIMQGTEAQIGNAAKYAEEFAGTQQRLSTESDKLAQSVGNALAPTLDVLMKVLIPIIQGVTAWVEQHPALTALLVTFGGVLTGVTTGLVGLSTAVSVVSTGLGVLQGSFAPFLIGGAVIAGILGIVGAMQSASTETEKFNEVTSNSIDNTLGLVEEYEKLNAKENKTAEDKKKLQDVSEKLAAVYPQSVEGINAETEAYRLNLETILLAQAVKEKDLLEKKIKEQKRVVETSKRGIEGAQLLTNISTKEHRIQEVEELIRTYEEVQAKKKKENKDLSGEDKERLGKLHLELKALREAVKKEKGGEDEKFATEIYNAAEKALIDLQNQLKALENAEANGDLASYFTNYHPKPQQKPPVTTNNNDTKKDEQSPFEKSMDSFNTLKTEGTFKSFQDEINYLKKIRDENAKTSDEKKSVQDMLFKLAMEQYEYLAQKEGWSNEKKIAYLNKEVTAFAYSNKLKADITDHVHQLQKEQQDQQYKQAMNAYEKEASVGKKTAEEKIALFKKIMKENGVAIEKSEKAQDQLHQLELAHNREKQQIAEDTQRLENQLKQDEIQNITDSREREIAKENQKFQEKLATAKNLNANTEEIQKQHNETIAGIHRKFDEEERRREDERMEIQFRNNEITYEMYREYLAARLSVYETDAKMFENGENYKTTLLRKQSDTRLQYEKNEQNVAKQARDYAIQNMAPGREKALAQAEAKRDDALNAIIDPAKGGGDFDQYIQIELAYQEEVDRIKAEFHQKELEAEDQKWAYLYEQQLISYEQYVQYLALRLNDYEEHSGQWRAIQAELTKTERDQIKQQQAEWKESFQHRDAELKGAYEAEKKVYESKLPWQTKQLDESRVAYKQYLEDCLKDMNISRDDYEKIQAAIASLDDEQLTAREERWKAFFGQIQGVISSLTSGLNFNFTIENEEDRSQQVDTISDQFSSNVSDLAAKGIGKLANTLVPGIGGIVEQIATTLFDLFSSDNWEENFEVMMEGIGEGIHKFWELLERVLRNLPKLLLLLIKEIGAMIGNLFLEIAEFFVNKFINIWNKFLGWIYKIDNVDWGWKDEEEKKDQTEDKDKENNKSDKAVTYGDITGPLADRFDDLISALSNLDRLPGLLDGIRNPIVEIRTDIGSIKQMICGDITGKITAGSNQNGETIKGLPMIQIDTMSFMYDEVKGKTVDQFFLDVASISTGSR